MSWEAFPTDVTSPTPTQLTGPNFGPEEVRFETPPGQPIPEPRKDEPPSQQQIGERLHF
jgi:hypothetical protein